MSFKIDFVPSTRMKSPSSQKSPANSFENQNLTKGTAA